MCEIILWEHFRLEGMELGSAVLYREEPSKGIVNKQHYNQSTLKEINSEYSLEGLMLKLKTPVLWPPAVNSQLTGKHPDAGKDWRQKEKRATEDEMVGWPHWFNRHELGQTLGHGEGPGGSMCCSPWDRKEANMTWWLKNRNYISHQFHRRASHHPANNQVRTRRNAQPNTTIWGTVGCVMTFTRRSLNASFRSKPVRA